MTVTAEVLGKRKLSTWSPGPQTVSYQELFLPPVSVFLEELSLDSFHIQECVQYEHILLKLVVRHN